MSSVADKSVTPQTPLALTPEYGLWDRILILRDQLIATKRFQRLAASLPIFRSISRSRASNLFDVMSGFVYSQILLACVRLNVFNHLKNGPLNLEELSRVTHFPMRGLQTLVDAAVAIRLLERRSEARYGLGALGSPLVGNDAIAAMVEHHTAFYADMRDPLALLSGSMSERNLGKYEVWEVVAKKFTGNTVLIKDPIKELDGYPLRITSFFQTYKTIFVATFLLITLAIVIGLVIAFSDWRFRETILASQLYSSITLSFFCLLLIWISTIFGWLNNGNWGYFLSFFAGAGIYYLVRRYGGMIKINKP